MIRIPYTKSSGFLVYRVAITGLYDASDSKSVLIFKGVRRLMHSTGVSRQQLRFRQGEQNSACVCTKTCAPDGFVFRQSVAPKSTSTGRPNAPAMCAGPESGLNTLCAPPNTLVSEPIVSFPRRSTNRPGAWIGNHGPSPTTTNFASGIESTSSW